MEKNIINIGDSVTFNWYVKNSRETIEGFIIKKRNNMDKGKTWQLWVFLAPAFLIYAIFSAWPLLDTLRLGLYSPTEDGSLYFSGFQNYLVILNDPQWSASFWNAMLNNFKFFVKT